MISSRQEKKNQELNECLNLASLYERVASETCRTSPGNINFQLDPIHWEKSSVHQRFLGDSIAAVPAAGVYSAKGSGTFFKSLHSEEECKKASSNAISKLNKCIALQMP